MINICAAAGATTSAVTEFAAGNLVLYADLACAAVLLLFLIIGLCKGFVTQVFNLLGSIASLVLASLLCGIVVKGLNDAFGLVDKLAVTLSTKFGSAEWLTFSISEENIRKACTDMMLPEFIANFAVNQTVGMVGSYANLGEFISHSLANLIVSGVTYVALFWLIKLVIFLLKKVFEKLVTLPGLHAANKLLGCVLGLIKGLIVVYVILFFISIIPAGEGVMASVKQAVAESSLTAFLSEHNVFAIAIAWIAAKFGLAA